MKRSLHQSVFWGVVLAVALACTLKSAAATAKIKIDSANGPAGKEVSIPIHIESKDEMGCMQFALEFDPAILEVKTLEAGPFLPDGATVDHNKDQAGWLRGGFVCSVSKPGLKGDGVALKVVFTVRGHVGQKSPLKLERVRAWESSDPEILVQTEAGELTVVPPTNFPWLYIAIGAGVLTLLILLILVYAIARRGGRPAVAPAGPTASAPAAPATALPSFTPEGATTIAHTCSKCGGVIQLPRAMIGQPFQCGACGAKQVAGT
jgi:hypothetical protein